MYLKDNETAGSDDINRRSLLFRYDTDVRHNVQNATSQGLAAGGRKFTSVYSCGVIFDSVRIPEIP